MVCLLPQRVHAKKKVRLEKATLGRNHGDRSGSVFVPGRDDRVHADTHLLAEV